MPRGGMSLPGGGMDAPSGARHEPTNLPRGGVSTAPAGAAGGGTRGGLQLAPPGRWWKDKKISKSLGLNGDQQKRMDDVFRQNRDGLATRYDTLQKAEGRLETLTHSGKPSETALSTEIDHVAQARADLEKAYTHMLLQLREEMTPEQIGRLDDQR